MTKKVYDEKKNYACCGCGFVDKGFNTKKGDKIFGCAKGTKYIICDRVYEIK